MTGTRILNLSADWDCITERKRDTDTRAGITKKQVRLFLNENKALEFWFWKFTETLKNKLGRNGLQ